MSPTLVAVLLLSNSSAGELDGLGHRSLGRFLMPPDGHMELVRQKKPTTHSLVGCPLMGVIGEVSCRDCVVT